MKKPTGIGRGAKVALVSLGCPKNLVDLQVVASALRGAGFDVGVPEDEADAILVNTCAFIESAKKESIDNIIDLGWLKKHKGLKGIIVAGCLSERYRDEVTKEMPEVDAVIGVGGIHRIGEAVKAVLDNAAKKGGKKKKFSCFEDKEA